MKGIEHRTHTLNKQTLVLCSCYSGKNVEQQSGRKDVRSPKSHLGHFIIEHDNSFRLHACMFTQVPVYLPVLNVYLPGYLPTKE